jgi:hypothetical protein
VPTVLQEYAAPEFLISELQWNVNWDSVAFVTDTEAKEFRSYEPLGPGGVPLQALSLQLLGMRATGMSVDVSMTSFTGEGTYGTFAEVTPGLQMALFSSDDVARTTTCETCMDIAGNAAVTIKVTVGPISVPVDLEFPFGTTSVARVDFPNTGVRPLALSAGGYRNTASEISEALVSLFGTGVSATNYVPRHMFIPTTSAIDLDVNFMAAAYTRYMASHNWIVSPPYARGAARGTFDIEDFLDYRPFAEALITPLVANSGGGVWRGDQHRVSSTWAGRASPFNYFAVEPWGVEHTQFSEATGVFLFERIFADSCERQPIHIDPRAAGKMGDLVERFRLQMAERVLERFFGVLPPLPPAEPDRNPWRSKGGTF